MKHLTKSLPLEMWLLILSPLSFKDLCTLSETSKNFHKLSNNEWLWRRKVLVDFEIDDILSVILGNSVDKTFEDLKIVISKSESSWKVVYSRIYQAKSKTFDFSTKISQPGDGWGFSFDDVFPNTTQSSPNKLKSILDFGMNPLPPVTVDNFELAVESPFPDPWRNLLKGRLSFERDLVNKIPTVTALRSLACRRCSEDLKPNIIGTSQHSSRFLYRGFSDVSSSLSHSALKICTCSNSVNSMNTSPVKYTDNFLELLSFVSTEDSIVVSDTVRSRSSSPTSPIPVVEYVDIPTRRNQSLPSNALSPFGSAPSRYQRH